MVKRRGPDDEAPSASTVKRSRNQRAQTSAAPSSSPGPSQRSAADDAGSDADSDVVEVQPPAKKDAATLLRESYDT